jgi:hypothetical protein
MVASGASIGDRIFGAVLLTLGLAFVIRWTRSGVVLVDQNRLVLRELWRTSEVPLDRIRHVATVEFRQGVMAYRRTALQIEFTDGSTRVFRDINSGPAASDRPSHAAQVAQELNTVVSERGVRTS